MRTLAVFVVFFTLLACTPEAPSRSIGQEITLGEVMKGETTSSTGPLHAPPRETSSVSSISSPQSSTSVFDSSPSTSTRSTSSETFPEAPVEPLATVPTFPVPTVTVTIPAGPVMTLPEVTITVPEPTIPPTIPPTTTEPPTTPTTYIGWPPAGATETDVSGVLRKGETIYSLGCLSADLLVDGRRVDSYFLVCWG